MLAWLIVSIVSAAIGSGILMQARKEPSINLGFLLACGGALSLMCWCAVAVVGILLEAFS
jgi:hypothetical protein